MRRVESAGQWVDHVWYPDTSAPEYLVAKAALDERRRARHRRALERIEAERGEELL